MRSFLLVAAAVVVIVAGLVLFAVEPNTLAKETISVGGHSVIFRIVRSGNNLYVTGSENRSFENGFNARNHIGTTAEIGTTSPEITVETDPDRVVLKIGRARIEFDMERQTFNAPVIGP